MGTLGGGVIVDPHPTHRRPRPWSAPHDSPATRLGLALQEAEGEGLEVSDLAVRLGASPADVAATVAACDGDVVRLGGRIFDARVRDLLRAELARLVDDHHVKSPLDLGAALQTLRARLVGRAELVDDAIRVATEQGVIEVDAGVVRRVAWAPRLTPVQGALKATLIDSLRAAGAEPPSVGELSTQHGATVSDLMRILDREGVVIPVESDRYYDAQALGALVGRLQTGMVPGREYSPGELREVIGLSRKFLIPFLEYCDRRGITERRSAGRVLHGT